MQGKIGATQYHARKTLLTQQLQAAKQTIKKPTSREEALASAKMPLSLPTKSLSKSLPLSQTTSPISSPRNVSPRVLNSAPISPRSIPVPGISLGSPRNEQPRNPLSPRTLQLMQQESTGQPTPLKAPKVGSQQRLFVNELLNTSVGQGERGRGGRGRGRGIGRGGRGRGRGRGTRGGGNAAVRGQEKRGRSSVPQQPSVNGEVDSLFDEIDSILLQGDEEIDEAMASLSLAPESDAWTEVEAILASPREPSSPITLVGEDLNKEEKSPKLQPSSGSKLSRSKEPAHSETSYSNLLDTILGTNQLKSDPDVVSHEATYPEDEEEELDLDAYLGQLLEEEGR